MVYNAYTRIFFAVGLVVLCLFSVYITEAQSEENKVTITSTVVQSEEEGDFFTFRFEGDLKEGDQIELYTSTNPVALEKKEIGESEAYHSFGYIGKIPAESLPEGDNIFFLNKVRSGERIVKSEIYNLPILRPTDVPPAPEEVTEKPKEPVSPTPPTTSTPAPVPIPELSSGPRLPEISSLDDVIRKIGDSGEDIRELQKVLNANAFIIAVSGPGSPGRESTYFGSKTAQAFVEFQQKNNLEVTGTYTKETQTIFQPLIDDYRAKEEENRIDATRKKVSEPQAPKPLTRKERERRVRDDKTVAVRTQNITQELLQQIRNIIAGYEEQLINYGTRTLVVKETPIPRNAQINSLVLRGLIGPQLLPTSKEVVAVPKSKEGSIQQFSESLKPSPRPAAQVVRESQAVFDGDVKPIFVGPLSLGAVHDQVYNLQVFLNREGYIVAQTGRGSPGRESNRFDGNTEAALRQFQIENGLRATGVFDLSTANLIVRY